MKELGDELPTGGASIILFVHTGLKVTLFEVVNFELTEVDYINLPFCNWNVECYDYANKLLIFSSNLHLFSLQMVDVSTGLLVLLPKQYHRKLFKFVHYSAMRIHNKAA